MFPPGQRLETRDAAGIRGYLWLEPWANIAMIQRRLELFAQIAADQ